MTPLRRRAVVAALALLGFALFLAVFAGAAWCDEERFGFFVQAVPAPLDVPALDFTVEDSHNYPDIQAALDVVGMPVRAADPESALLWVSLMEEEGAAAVRVQGGQYYIHSYEQQPSRVWTQVCG